MNSLKRILACFLLSVCAVLVVACGEDKSEQKKSGNEENGSKKLITLGYAQNGTDAKWSEAYVASVKEHCTEENGIKLLYENGEGDEEKQKQIIKSYIEQKVDIIGFTPQVSDGWEELLQEAKDAGIPVVLLDRTINASEDLYECWIGSDFLLEGYKAADWLIDYMNNRGAKKNGKYKVAIFQGTIGAAAEVGRTQGVEEMLGETGDYQIVYKESGDFSTEGGITNMQNVLKKKLDIDILIAENDNMALGAIEVMEKNGIRPGKDIVIVSFDGVHEAFEAMIEGKINCDMECNPLSGKPFMEAIKKVMNGDPVEKRKYLQEQLFPAETAADYIDNRKY